MTRGLVKSAPTLPRAFSPMHLQRLRGPRSVSGPPPSAPRQLCGSTKVGGRTICASHLTVNALETSASITIFIPGVWARPPFYEWFVAGGDSIDAIEAASLSKDKYKRGMETIAISTMLACDDMISDMHRSTPTEAFTRGRL